MGTAGGAWGLPGAGESRSALPLRVAAAHRDVLGRQRHRFLREELTLAWSPVAVRPRGAAWLWDVDGGGSDVLPWNHTPFPKAALPSAPGSGLSAAVPSALVLPDLTRRGWRPWAPVWFSNLFAHCGDRLRPLHDREEVSVPPKRGMRREKPGITILAHRVLLRWNKEGCGGGFRDPAEACT